VGGPPSFPWVMGVTTMLKFSLEGNLNNPADQVALKMALHGEDFCSIVHSLSLELHSLANPPGGVFPAEMPKDPEEAYLFALRKVSESLFEDIEIHGVNPDWCEMCPEDTDA